MGYVGVIIEEPPRHGKSEMGSHFGPAWFLGTFPDKRVMLASYEADFAAEWGRKTRDTLEMWGPPVFGVEVSKRSKASDRWDIAGHKGGMTTAGVGGKFTGRGADLLIVDDPVKNKEEADSETIRDKHWGWWRTTARTRLQKNGVICLIATRWHEDDLLGRIIQEMKDNPNADQYLIIRLPMIAEEPDEDYPDADPLGRVPGEVLWPEMFDLEAADKLRETVREGPWAALYQQRPTPVEGAMFDDSWFNLVQKPSGIRMKLVRCWDMAATEEGEGHDPDWTVGAKVGLDEDGLFYVLDIIRVRESPAKTENRIKAAAVLDGKKVKIRMEQEPGSAGKSVISHFRRKVLRGYAFRGERSTGNKSTRAGIVASAAEQGDVNVVRAPWNAEFFREFRRFPNGAHDDIVDAVSGGFDELASKRKGKVATW